MKNGVRYCTSLRLSFRLLFRLRPGRLGFGLTVVVFAAAVIAARALRALRTLRTVGRLGAAASLFGLRSAFHLYRAHGSFATLTVPAATRRTGLLLLLRGLCRSRFRLQ